MIIWFSFSAFPCNVQELNIAKTARRYSQLPPVDISNESFQKLTTVRRKNFVPCQKPDVVEPNIMELYPLIFLKWFLWQCYIYHALNRHQLWPNYYGMGRSRLESGHYSNPSLYCPYKHIVPFVWPPVREVKSYQVQIFVYTCERLRLKSGYCKNLKTKQVLFGTLLFFSLLHSHTTPKLGLSRAHNSEKASYG